MEVSVKELFYNFKINGYKKDIFFILGILFWYCWGYLFKILEFECWY